MSAQQAVNTIRRIARHEVEQRNAVALGVVQSLHGSNGEPSYACTVELRDSGIVLPKVPIATGLIGTAALPREKDLVVVVFAGGDLHAPVVMGRLYTEEVAPPDNGPGEFVLGLPGDETATGQDAWTCASPRPATARAGSRSRSTARSRSRSRSTTTG